MCAAFPRPDYYEGSAPSPGHQQTACLPAAGLAGRARGQPGDGSHVHHEPVDEHGAQLFPGSPATSTPQAFPVTTGPASIPAAPESINPFQGLPRAASRPVSTRFEPVSFLRGFHHWFTRVTPSHRAHRGPGRLAVPARPGFVRAAPTLPGTSRIRLPSASPACCDRPEAGPSIPPGPIAPRGARRRTESLHKIDSLFGPAALCCPA
jgi:hypothetical protein